MNNDLISREALKKALEEDMKYGGVKTDEFDKGYDLGVKAAIEMLDNAPTVEPPKQLVLRARDNAELDQLKRAWGKGEINFTPIVAWVERPQGEWIHDEFGRKICGKCQFPFVEFQSRNYCSLCGADMRKWEEEE